jgi:hypothetical protein
MLFFMELWYAFILSKKTHHFIILNFVTILQHDGFPTTIYSFLWVSHKDGDNSEKNEPHINHVFEYRKDVPLWISNVAYGLIGTIRGSDKW